MAAHEFLTSSLINDANLKCYYRFESGALTTDSSGNGKTLTQTGTVSSSAGGQFGNDADATFGTANNLISTPLTVAIGTGDVSITCWFKKNGAPSPTFIPAAIASVGDIGGTGERFSICTNKTTGYASLQGYDGTNNPTASSTVNVCDNAWHFLVYTRTGNDQILYVDGSSAATVSTTFGDVAGTKFGVGITIADEEVGAALVDDATVFNRLLTATEVANLWQGFSASLSPSPSLSPSSSGSASASKSASASASRSASRSASASESKSLSPSSSASVSASASGSSSVSASPSPAEYVNKYTVYGSRNE